MFVDPSMIDLLSNREREAKTKLLLWIRHYVIVTMNVEKATERSRLPEAAIAGDCTGLRSWTRPCHPGAAACRGWVGVCVRGRNDSSHKRRNLGRAYAAGRLDTGSHSAQYSHVGRGVDADDLPASASGTTASTNVLRSERFTSAAADDHSSLYGGKVESKIANPCTPDSRSDRSARNRAGSSSTAAQPVGPESRTCRGSTAGKFEWL